MYNASSASSNTPLLPIPIRLSRWVSHYTQTNDILAQKNIKLFTKIQTITTQLQTRSIDYISHEKQTWEPTKFEKNSIEQLNHEPVRQLFISTYYFLTTQNEDLINYITYLETLLNTQDYNDTPETTTTPLTPPTFKIVGL